MCGTLPSEPKGEHINEKAEMNWAYDATIRIHVKLYVVERLASGVRDLEEVARVRA